MSFYLAAIMIVAAVALFVAAPLVEGVRSRRRAAPPGDAERFEHQRALALQGLRELEFDHEMGKLDEADYAALKGTLENRALAAMAALDRLSAPPSANRATPVMPEPEATDPLARPSPANRAARVMPGPDRGAQLAPSAEQDATPVMPGLDPGISRAPGARTRASCCPRCGGALESQGNFCPACGAPLDAPAAARAR